MPAAHLLTPFRLGIRLFGLLFALETTLSHVLRLAGYPWDAPLSWYLIGSHLCLYLLAGALTGLLALALERCFVAQLPGVLVPAVGLSLYLAPLAAPRLTPVLTQAGLSVTTAQPLLLWLISLVFPALAIGVVRLEARLRRPLTLLLLTSLLFLSTASLLNLRLPGGSLFLPRNLALNLIWAGLCAGSVLLASAFNLWNINDFLGIPRQPDPSPPLEVTPPHRLWSRLERRLAALLPASRAPSSPGQPTAPPGRRQLARSLVLAGVWGMIAYQASLERPGVGSVPAAVQPSPSAPSRPDLILVVVDCLRADRLGFMGYSSARTPTLDGLARTSWVFPAHQSASPWTLPSFGSLLTGRSPFVHQATLLRAPDGSGDRERYGLSPLRPQLPTLATLLRQAGYRTGLIGSNPYLSQATGLSRGFDHYEVALRSAARYLTLPAALAGVGWRPLEAGDPTLPASDMTPRFLDFLAASGPQPRFLLAHYMDPHFPYAPPERFSPLSGPPPLDRRRPISRLSAFYDGEISFVDEELGRLLSWLETSNRRQNTVLVVTADHGETFGDRGGWVGWDEQPAGPDPFYARGVDHGQTLYQELLHVPLLISLPGQGPGRYAGLSRGVDLLPTLLAAVGVQGPEGLEGRNLLANLKTPSPFSVPGATLPPDEGTSRAVQAGASIPEPPALSEGLLSGSEKQAWRSGSYKLIRKPSWPKGNQLELYDLRADPGEKQDLSGTNPVLASQLEAQLLAHIQAELARGIPLAPPSSGPAPAPDAAWWGRLKALGYVQ